MKAVEKAYFMLRAEGFEGKKAGELLNLYGSSIYRKYKKSEISKEIERYIEKKMLYCKTFKNIVDFSVFLEVGVEEASEMIFDFFHEYSVLLFFELEKFANFAIDLPEVNKWSLILEYAKFDEAAVNLNGKYVVGKE